MESIQQWQQSKSGYNFTFMIAFFSDNDDVEPLEDSCLGQIAFFVYLK
jgi:hypothetical protein